VTTAYFIVLFAREKWWIDLNGASKGPFLTQDTAEHEAISLAGAYARQGKRAEVRLAEPGKHTRVIWQNGDRVQA
jgi:hypothetical protein